MVLEGSEETQFQYHISFTVRYFGLQKNRWVNFTRTVYEGVDLRVNRHRKDRRLFIRRNLKRERYKINEERNRSFLDVIKPSLTP